MSYQNRHRWPNVWARNIVEDYDDERSRWRNRQNAFPPSDDRLMRPGQHVRTTSHKSFEDIWNPDGSASQWDAVSVPRVRYQNTNGLNSFWAPQISDGREFNFNESPVPEITNQRKTESENTPKTVSTDTKTPLIVTGQNLAAALRLDCALSNLDQLLEIHQFFDKECRDSKSKDAVMTHEPS